VDFLFKPVSREILRGKVRVFVELFESRRELADANARLEAANSKLLALMDEQEASTSALRQANDELNSALSGLRAGAALPAVPDVDVSRGSGVRFRLEPDVRAPRVGARRR
jgi:response regulator RpfG family c-di-GMP phosphodiesterase